MLTANEFRGQCQAFAAAWNALPEISSQWCWRQSEAAFSASLVSQRHLSLVPAMQHGILSSHWTASGCRVVAGWPWRGCRYSCPEHPLQCRKCTRGSSALNWTPLQFLLVMQQSVLLRTTSFTPHLTRCPSCTSASHVWVMLPLKLEGSRTAVLW